MQKTVCFDKLAPYTLVTTEDGAQIEKRLDLSGLFKVIAPDPQKPTLREILGEKYRFHICKYHEDRKIWELQILHLREALLPGIADEETEYKLLTLPDGNYVAESCTVIYDEANVTVYLQQNKMCMSASRLALYLRGMLPEDTRLLFKPIYADEKALAIDEHTRFKKVILCYSADQKKGNEDGSGLGTLLNTFGKYQGHAITISIGMGRRKGLLNSHETRNLILEAYEASDVNKLRVQMSNDVDKGFEWFDLLENREQLKCIVQYDRDDPITHEKLFTACMKEYK